MKKYLFCVILVSSFFGTFNSQTITGKDYSISAHNSGLVRQIAFEKNYKKNFTDTDLKDIDGSPYISPLFISAKISNIPDLQRIRYNALEDEIQLNINDVIYILNKDPKIFAEQVDAKPVRILYMNYPVENKNVDGYLFELFSNSKMSLLERKKVIFQDAVPSKNPIAQEKSAKFVVEPSLYFIKFEDGKIVEFPEKKKEILKLFPEKVDIINNYFKSNKIDTKNPKTIIGLLQVIN